MSQRITRTNRIALVTAAGTYLLTVGKAPANLHPGFRQRRNFHAGFYSPLHLVAVLASVLCPKYIKVCFHPSQCKEEENKHFSTRQDA